jgi:hypothetical protein
MTCGYIYKIEFPNGKHYIGLTSRTLEQRTKEHKRRAKGGDAQYLYNALRKYDMVDTFELIEIDTSETKEELCELEIEYIQDYNSYYLNEKGYNMTFGGEGLNGYIRTEEDKQKMSEGAKKRFENQEERKKLGESRKIYYKKNPEAGKEHGERLKEYYEKNPEARQQASERTKKQFESPEARQKSSQRTKNYYKKNPEAGKEQGEQIKKHYEDNPNARKEHSERLKEYYEKNPEEKLRMSERSKKQFESPEARRKTLDARGKNKPFDVFTIDGTFVKTFCYQFEAKQYLQKENHITSNIDISAVLLGTQCSSAGFIFTYK